MDNGKLKMKGGFKMLFFALFLPFLFGIHGCKIYSFSGASIPPDVKTFTIDIFETKAQNAPASYGQTLTDNLKLKLVTEASLRQETYNGDVHFKGSVTSYTVAALAPTAQIQTGVNRLTITVQVDYQNAHDEKDKWTKSFSRYAEFPSTSLLTNVQDDLITNINKQLVDDIFNEAFAKW